MREAATGNNRSPTVDSRVDCATETSTWDEMPCAGTASTEQNRNRPRRRSWWSWFGRCQRAPIDSSDCGFRVSSSRRRQWHWSSVATQTTSDPTTNQPSNTNNNMAAIHSNNRIIVRNLVCVGTGVDCRRLTFSANKYDHVSSLLRDLHFTGCKWYRELITRLTFSYISVCTDLLQFTCLLIYRASRTCCRDSDYGHGRRTR